MSETGIPISGLPAAGSIAEDAVFPLSDGDTTYKATKAQLRTQLGVDAAQATAESAAAVYVHDGDGYVLTGGRIFVGPEDPDDDGFTLVDGDQWLDPS